MGTEVEQGLNWRAVIDPFLSSQRWFARAFIAVGTPRTLMRGDGRGTPSRIQEQILPDGLPRVRVDRAVIRRLGFGRCWRRPAGKPPAGPPLLRGKRSQLQESTYASGQSRVGKLATFAANRVGYLSRGQWLIGLLQRSADLVGQLVRVALTRRERTADVFLEDRVWAWRRQGSITEQYRHKFAAAALSYRA